MRVRIVTLLEIMGQCDCVDVPLSGHEDCNTAIQMEPTQKIGRILYRCED